MYLFVIGVEYVTRLAVDFETFFFPPTLDFATRY